MNFVPNQMKQSTGLLAISFLISIMFFSGQAQAQLDQTFGSGGKTTSDLLGADAANNIFYLPNGKLMVFGTGTVPNPNTSKYYFARYNSNGTIDSTYGTNGIVILNSIPVITTGTEAPGIARQPDGKFIIVGSDQGAGLIARLNEDGTLDTSFAGTGIHRPNISADFDDVVTDVVIQPDGKILVSGISATAGNYAYYTPWFLRYNPDGTFDPSFLMQGTSTFSWHEGYANNRKIRLLLQSTGKFLAFNRSDSYSLYLVRYNSNGTRDTSFANVNFSATYASPLAGVVLQPDDKILILDNTSESSLDTNIRLRRYTSDGVLDMTFDGDGTVLTDISFGSDDYSASIAVQPDGKILIAGSNSIRWGSYFSGNRFMLARYNSNGSLDGKMLTGFIKNDYARAIAVQPDGKIVLAGNILNSTFPYQSDTALSRYMNVPMESYRYRGVLYNFVSGYSSAATYEPRACMSIYRPGIAGNDSRWYSECNTHSPSLGGAGDIPVAADYSGRLTSDYAVYRPSNSTWYINSMNVGIVWGQTGDIPVPGYYDADTKADLAVFRPSTGTWFIRRSSDLSSYSVRWGLNGDKPVVGDYDGDGLDDIAVWRPSDGVWYILNSSTNQPTFLQWGLNSDKPVQADYDGDGKTDAAIWRPSEGNWYILNSSNFSYTGAHWGISSDIPTPADYDGDHKADIAVWRPGDTNWYILQSSNSTPFIYQYGVSTDIPVPGK